MDPLPSGQTVIGTEHWDLEATGAGSDFEFIFHLPFTPTEPLDSASIFFAPDVDVHDGDENPACSGTFLAPTAPPALLCVYVGATAATDGNHPGRRRPDRRPSNLGGMGGLGSVRHIRSTEMGVYSSVNRQPEPAQGLF